MKIFKLHFEAIEREQIRYIKWYEKGGTVADYGDNNNKINVIADAIEFLNLV